MALLASVPLIQGWLALSISRSIFRSASAGCLLSGCKVQLRRMAAACLQSGDALPSLYFRYLRLWFMLGWPAFTAVLAIFYLMVFKPEL